MIYQIANLSSIGKISRLDVAFRVNSHNPKTVTDHMK
jgi:hypothetical protein